MPYHDVTKSQWVNPCRRDGASTTRVLVLPKMINMNILKSLYSSTTRVLIFQYSYSYVQYSPQPCLVVLTLVQKTKKYIYIFNHFLILDSAGNWNPSLWLAMIYHAVNTLPRLAFTKFLGEENSRTFPGPFQDLCSIFQDLSLAQRQHFQQGIYIVIMFSTCFQQHSKAHNHMGKMSNVCWINGHCVQSCAAMIRFLACFFIMFMKDTPHVVWETNFVNSFHLNKFTPAIIVQQTPSFYILHHYNLKIEHFKQICILHLLSSQV